MGTPTIGFIGMGIMGLPMALNAKKGGFRVLSYNRSPTRLSEAKKAGLETAASPKELAEKSEVLLTMVTDPSAVRNVLMGKDGVFEAPVSGKTLIQTSTIDQKSTLEFAKAAKDKGMDFLDAPVTGSKKQVEEAQLIFLAGGEASLIEKWKRLLLTMGKHIVHAGDIGQGTALKLCMNLVVSQMTTALCEAVALAKALELDPGKIFEVLDQSPALNCGYYKIKQKGLLEGHFAPAFSLNNMLKDVRFMDQAAENKKLRLPVTRAVRGLMEEAAVEGFGNDDLTSILKLLKPK
ncbi:MAG: NAD(P)-dependent oxidoreductase [Elusimicrobia bacterium]|nr:NAD(P)-dependent oxidoreductase [Candidatus Obscuribacterium magneticum]